MKLQLNEILDPKNLKEHKYLLLFLLIAFIHSFLVIRYGFNLPYWDEWEVLNPDAIPSGFTLKWIFAPHNEHIAAITNFLILVSYEVDKFNITHFIALSWFTFLTLVLFVFKLFLEAIPTSLKKLAPLLFLFLLSPITHESHQFAVQIGFHLAILFQMLALYWYFNYGLHKYHKLIVAFCFSISSYAFSIGLPMTLTSFIGIGLITLINSYQSWKQNPSHSSLIKVLWPGAKNVATTCLVYGLSILYLITRYSEVPKKLKLSQALFDLNFWKFLCLQWGLGFGFNEHPNLWQLGLLPFGIFVLSTGYLIFKRDADLKKHGFWIIFGFCILAVQTAIAYGRYTFGFKSAHSSRYAEMAIFWVPVTAALLFSALKNSPLYLNKIFWGFFIVLFLGYADDWDFRHYRFMAERKIDGAECIKKSAETNYQNVLCPSIYPYELGAERILTSKTLKFSFSDQY